MHNPIKLEQTDGIHVFRAMGSHRFRQAVALVSEVIVQAREQGAKKLLIVATGLTGFPSPSLSERHWMVREWVDASQGSLIIALVVPAAFIDEDKFGVVAAANFGVTADVFTTETEAMEWLGNIR